VCVIFVLVFLKLHLNEIAPQYFTYFAVQKSSDHVCTVQRIHLCKNTNCIYPFTNEELKFAPLLYNYNSEQKIQEVTDDISSEKGQSKNNNSPSDETYNVDEECDYFLPDSQKNIKKRSSTSKFVQKKKQKKIIKDIDIDNTSKSESDIPIIVIDDD